MRLDVRGRRRIEQLLTVMPRAHQFRRAHRRRAAVGVVVGLAMSSLVAGSSASGASASTERILAGSSDGSVREVGAGLELDRLDLASEKLPDHGGRGKEASPTEPTTTTVPVSEVTDLGIPAVALQAYRSAMASMHEADPGCRIDWSLIAGIGRVESDHGRYGGRRPTIDGSVQPPILGIPLDGRPGVALIRDTDGGRLDFDTTYDRAVGPMQFIPGTWSAFPDADGDGNGIVDPHNLNDAALATASYLCSGPGDLSQETGQRSAVFRYNHSESYVDLVLAHAQAYAVGVTLSGPPPQPVGPPPTVPQDPVDNPAHPQAPLPPDPGSTPTTEPPTTTEPPPTTTEPPPTTTEPPPTTTEPPPTTTEPPPTTTEPPPTTTEPPPTGGLTDTGDTPTLSP